MRRQVLVFSIRTSGEPSAIDALRPQVEAALGCTFRPNVYNRIPALVAEVLGMQIGMFGWRGQGDRGVIRLDAQLGEPRIFDYVGTEAPEIEFIDIGRAVADVLTIRGAGDWYLPDASDLEAEEAYGAELERSFYATHDEAE